MYVLWPTLFFCHQFFPHCVHMLTVFCEVSSIQVNLQYFCIFMKFHVLPYFTVILFHLPIYMSPVLNHIYGDFISMILVCLFVSTKLCIQLIPCFVSFFPTSFEPPHTTTISCFDSFCISLLAGVIIVFNPAPRFTNSWT